MADFKHIKFNPENHQHISRLAEQLRSERNAPKLSLPAYLLEAVTFFETHRPRPTEANRD